MVISNILLADNEGLSQDRVIQPPNTKTQQAGPINMLMDILHRLTDTEILSVSKELLSRGIATKLASLLKQFGYTIARSDDSFVLFPITLYLSANNFRNKGMIFCATP
jgi:hypothetical protein